MKFSIFLRTLMPQQYYKSLFLISGFLFLLSIMSVGSVVLLLMTLAFFYQYIKKLISQITQKDLYKLMPKKWKKHIQQNSIAQYIGNLNIVKNTPFLSYLIPILSLKFMENQKQTQIKKINNQKNYTNESKRIQNCSYKYSGSMNKMINQDNEKLMKIQKTHFMKNQNQEIKEPLMTMKREFTTQKQFMNFNHLQNESSTTVKKNYPRKTSFILKKKFAQENSSQTQELNYKNNEISKRWIQTKNNEFSNQIIISPHNKFNPSSDGKSHSISHPHNPLRTFQEYIKALIWMMKRLLGLKKMTNKIKRTSTAKITLIASFFWIVIYLQIKVDSRKGKLFFKSLHVLSCVLSILAGLGASAILIYKIHKSVIGVNQNSIKQNGKYLEIKEKQKDQQLKQIK